MPVRLTRWRQPGRLPPVSSLESSTSRFIAVALPVTLLVYALVAALVLHRRISAAAALFVGILLWRRHRRARFSAYVFLSAVAVRGVLTHVWPLAAGAAAAIALLQLPAARRAWPSVTSARFNGDRMAPP